MKTINYFSLVLLLLCLGFISIFTKSEAFAKDRIRAKIGIEIVSGEQSTLAKSKARIKVGDQLRIVCRQMNVCQSRYFLRDTFGLYSFGK